jgi:hypothetical protein
MAGYDYFTGAPYCLTFASPTGIKTAIQNKYNTLSTRPEHVLLVGDHGDIGTWEYDVDGETVNSDLGYTQLDGSDVFADVKFGRWPVANEQELENIVNKTITMENKFRASTISPKRATLIADYDLTFEMVLWGCMFDETIDTIRQPIIDDGYSDEFINKRTGGTPPRVIAALNDNPYLVVYNGHGDVDEWVGPSFTAGNASNLSNTIYPVIFSSACYTGNFIHAGDPSASPCLGEEFIRRAHGACAFWGATRTTYVYWDHHLTRAVFNDGFKQTGSIAGMINIGIRDIANRIGNFMYAHRAISITAYHLFGDPSLQVRYNDCETDMKLYAGATDAGETVQYRPAANITVAGDAPSYVPGQYTVKSGGSLTLKANETIVLKPGFVAEAGSTFSASITSETCTPGSSSGMAPTRAGESIAEAIIETTDEDAGIAPDTGPSIEAYPNPFTESFTLSFNCDVPADVFVRLYDMSGNLIKVVAANTQYGAGTHQLTVNGAGLAQGVYLLQLNINRKNIVFKIVKTE